MIIDETTKEDLDTWSATGDYLSSDMYQRRMLSDYSTSLSLSLGALLEKYWSIFKRISNSDLMGSCG
jgi:hypothetical protein